MDRSVNIFCLGLGLISFLTGCDVATPASQSPEGLAQTADTITSSQQLLTTLHTFYWPLITSKLNEGETDLMPEPQ